MGLFDNVLAAKPVKNGQYFSAGTHVARVDAILVKDSQKDKKVKNVIVETTVMSSKGGAGHEGLEPAIDIGASRALVFDVNDESVGARNAKKFFVALYQCENPRATLDTVDSDQQAFSAFMQAAIGLDQPKRGYEIRITGTPVVTKSGKQIIALEYTGIGTGSNVEAPTPADKPDQRVAELRAKKAQLKAMDLDDDTVLSTLRGLATKLGDVSLVDAI